MRSTLLTFALSALAATPALAAPSGDEWFADYDEALAAAKEQEKDLLVDFTGSDWCGWCIKLDNEVFSHDEFLTGVADDFVLVKLDFPRSEEVRAKVPNPERNQELSDAWGIGGFPTVMLVNTDGQPFAQTGYRPGGPVDYVAFLDKIASQGKAARVKFDRVASAFEQADAAGRATALGSVLDLLDEVAAFQEELGTQSPLTKPLLGMVRESVPIEGEEHAELELRAFKALLQNGIYDDELGALIQTADPDNAKGLLEITLLAGLQSMQSVEDVQAWVDHAVEMSGKLTFVDEQVHADVLFNIAYLSHRYLEAPERAAAFAKQTLELKVITNEQQLAILAEILGVEEQS
ncbi:MAG: thioredoxin family protein [Planctomycetota bacterium]